MARKVQEDPKQQTGMRTRRTVTLEGTGPQLSLQNQDPTRTRIQGLGTTRVGELPSGILQVRPGRSPRTTATLRTTGGSITQQTRGHGEETGARDWLHPLGAPSQTQRSPTGGVEQEEVRADVPHCKTEAKDTQGDLTLDLGTGDVWIMCPRAKRLKQVRQRENEWLVVRKEDRP